VILFDVREKREKGGHLKTNMKREQICEICMNIGDMSGEEVAYLLELAFEKGAAEAWAESVLLRNRRPAFRVVVQCVKGSAASFCALMLRNSTARGITIETKDRLILDEETVYIETTLGMIRVSKAGANRHIVYEDLARVARQNGLTIATAREILLEEINL
jgi:uncharacterized protein (DUF111 family)